MNRLIVRIVVLVLFLFLVATVVVARQPPVAPSSSNAQAAGGPGPSVTPTSLPPELLSQVAARDAMIPLKTAIGRPVKDPNGQTIGQLDDLLADLRDSSVSYALVSLGTGKGSNADGRLYPVRLTSLRIDGQSFTLITGKSTIQNTRPITRQQLSTATSLSLPGGVQPYWASGALAAKPGLTDGAATATPTAEVAATGTMEADSGPPPLVLASYLTGFEIWNPQGQRMGEIQDVVVDVRAGRLAYAILAHGSNLDAQKRFVPVPMEALSFHSSTETFALKATAPDIGKAPNFEQTQWPDMSQPGWDAAIQLYWHQKT